MKFLNQDGQLEVDLGRLRVQSYRMAGWYVLPLLAVSSYGFGAYYAGTGTNLRLLRLEAGWLCWKILFKLYTP